MDRAITLPNLITIGRLVIVPLTVAAISEGRLDWAFWLFVVAGASDGVDGFIARRWDLRSKLGAYLDPIADKALLVAIYVTLGITGNIPAPLVILIVSRDLIIVGAFMLAWVMGKPVEVRPLFVSKVNTAAQIFLAGVVLGDAAFALDLSGLIHPAVVAVGALTVVSGAAYVRGWLRAMSAEG